MTTPLPSRDVAPLFRPLLAELLLLLRGLGPRDWERQTVAPRWKVRDVAAHLLDVELRKTAAYRDDHDVTSGATIAAIVTCRVSSMVSTPAAWPLPHDSVRD